VPVRLATHDSLLLLEECRPWLYFAKGRDANEGRSTPGRAAPLKVSEKHFVNGHRIVPPFPAGLKEAIFGMGCFWGAERLFWELPGVYWRQPPPEPA
jgi:hypothetical protein